MIHRVWTHDGNHVFSWGEGGDKPELDRFQIKKALLTVVPDAKIRWNSGIATAKRGQDGKVVLHLDDGSTATGFKLVVGADGTWSKVRPLVSTKYSSLKSYGVGPNIFVEFRSHRLLRSTQGRSI